MITEMFPKHGADDPGSLDNWSWISYERARYSGGSDRRNKTPDYVS